MMEQTDAFLKREYKKALFPVMFSILGGTINALIDTIFVSKSIGRDALAAVNLSMPVYLLLCVIGILFASGASVLSTQKAGEEDLESARRLYHTAFTWYLVVGAVITAAGIIFAGSLADILSQKGELRDLLYPYVFVILLGAFPAMFLYLPVYYLQLEGKHAKISIMTGIMVVADVIFDALFLFVFSFGTAGAAAASVISMVISCSYGVYALHHGFSNYRFDRHLLGFKDSLLIMRTGSVSAVGNLADTGKLLILNKVILDLLGVGGSAIWAVMNSFLELSLMILTGVPQTAVPMTGMYYSSKENSAIRLLMRIQVRWGMMLGASYGILLIACHRPIAFFFGISENLLIPFVSFFLYLLFDCLCSIWITEFRATDQILLSGIMVLLRKFVMPVSAVFLFYTDQWFFWFFLPAGAVLTLFSGCILTGFIKYHRKKHRKFVLSRFLLLDDHLEKEHKILDFSIRPDVEEVCAGAEKIRDFCEVNEMEGILLMRLSLAIEELLVYLVEHQKNLGSVDLRVFVLTDTTGIQIRYGGEYYNPFELAKEGDADALMGIRMIEKLAMDVTHIYVAGFNRIHVFFDRRGEEQTA